MTGPSCMLCAHVYEKKIGVYYCRRTRTLCRVERKETGECKPDAVHWLHWKERAWGITP